MLRSRPVLALAVLVLAACGPNPAAVIDGGPEDAGPSAQDAGSSDAGVPPDAGAPDGGFADGGLPDGGPDDGGPSDGGTFDGGPSDGGVADGGALDAGPADGGPVGPCNGGGLAPGRHELTIQHDERERSFTVYVPDGYAASAPVPVVYDFHGNTSYPEQQASFSRMRDKADEEGFVVVHPDGYGGSFNAGGCCGTAQYADIDDVGFFRRMVAELDGLVCVDPRRIYVTGFSNGAIMAHLLACEASDVVAAVGPVAGGLLIDEDACVPSRPVPVLHFHGLADTIVPYYGNLWLGWPSIPGMMRDWAARDGCAEDDEDLFSDLNVDCDTFPGCDAGAEVTLCTVAGEGHVWPGAFGSVSAVDATDLIWAFFAAHPLP